MAGFVLGPMLGVFLVGMLTRHRGNEAGNLIAVVAGLLTTFFSSGLHVNVANWFTQPGHEYVLPTWWLKVPFTWYTMVGAITTFTVGMLFRTPASMVVAAQEKRMLNVEC
jgi:Na+/proline symporter